LQNFEANYATIVSEIGNNPGTNLITFLHARIAQRKSPGVLYLGSFPAALDRYLTALPAMSLAPVAPFLSAQPRFCGLHIAHADLFGAR